MKHLIPTEFRVLFVLLTVINVCLSVAVIWIIVHFVTKFW